MRYIRVQDSAQALRSPSGKKFTSIYTTGGFCSLETALRTSGLQADHRVPGNGVTRSLNGPQNSTFLRPGNPSSILQKNQYQPLAPHLSVPKRVSNTHNNAMVDSTNQHMNVVLAILLQCNSSKPSPSPRSRRNCQEFSETGSDHFWTPYGLPADRLRGRPSPDPEPFRGVAERSA
ncbi:hypothetical protein DFH28DRAFT_930908 [Melampsora americana]|nr:hypothetical protein DFH28DRAFT_930908 [Melampsora americana]